MEKEKNIIIILNYYQYQKGKFTQKKKSNEGRKKLHKNKLQIMQGFIRKDNLQIKYGDSAPDIYYGEDYLFY